MESTNNPPPMPHASGEDEQHLQLLGIFHYVVAGLVAFFACIPLLHVAMGVAFVFFPEFLEKEMAPEEVIPTRIFGGLFILLGGFFVLAGWVLAAVLAYAGTCLRRHKHRTFCLVVAAIACTFMPFGTVLGVFTIIVLMKPSVRTLFEPGIPG